MIVAKLKDLHRYDSLNPLFRKAFDWILSTDLKSLETGRIELLGKDLFANIQEYESKNIEESFFEAHRNYIDIQFLISGKENILWANLENLKEIEAYNSDSDFHKLSGQGEECISVDENTACILFPEDAHMPCINYKEGKTSHIKKVCMKVKV